MDIYNWFERWLKKSEQRIEEEPPVAPETDKTLWVGPTGNVARDFSSLSPFDFVKRQAEALSRTGSPMHWAEAIGLRKPAKELKLQRLARVRSEGAAIEAIEVRSGREVWIPAWRFTPDKPDASQAALLVLDDKGRNAYAGEDGVYHRLARKGRNICAADIRGIGDTRPEVGRGNPGYTIPHDSEEDFAWASLIFGDALLTQRIEDILAIVQAMRNEPSLGNGHLTVAARGRLTVPALFAFAASSSIDSLYLAGGLASYQNLLETENYYQPLSNFAWDLFRVTDLPKLAVDAAPRRIHLAGAVDAANNPMDPATLRGIYSAGNIEVSASPGWDENSLEST
jgi:hypothetical protein